MMKTLGVHQPHVLAGIEYFARMGAVDMWVYLDDVKFNPQDWQNRNRIKFPFKDQYVTIPVTGSRNERILDKKISYGKKGWAEKLWTTIEQTYGKQPHFDDIAWMEGVLLAKHPDLVGLIAAMNEKFREYLGIETPAVWASSLGPTEARAGERLAELAIKTGCDTYVAGPQGWTYMKPEPFANVGVEVRAFHWECPVYPQRWDKDGFVPNLSVLDLIANVGTEAADLIRGGIQIGEGEWGRL